MLRTSVLWRGGSRSWLIRWVTMIDYLSARGKLVYIGMECI